MKKFRTLLLITFVIIFAFCGCKSVSNDVGNENENNVDYTEETLNVTTSPYSQYSITDSGYCGTPNSSNVVWNYYAEINAIEFIGTGDIKDFSYYDQSNDIPWYDYRDTIEQVYISEGITRIGDRVFEKFNSINEIKLPNSVTSIGEYQFWACDNLTDIYFSNSVVEIEDCAFATCDSLSAIHYNGTQSEWDLINIAEDVFLNTTQEVSLCFE